MTATVQQLAAMTPPSGGWPGAAAPPISSAAQELAAMVGAFPRALTGAHGDLVASAETINRAVAASEGTAATARAVIRQLAGQLVGTVSAVAAQGLSPAMAPVVSSTIDAACRHCLAQADTVIAWTTAQLSPVAGELATLAGRTRQAADSLTARASAPPQLAGKNIATAAASAHPPGLQLLTPAAPDIPRTPPPTAPATLLRAAAAVAAAPVGRAAPAAPPVPPPPVPPPPVTVPPVAVMAGAVPQQLRPVARTAITHLYRAFGIDADGLPAGSDRPGLPQQLSGQFVPQADTAGYAGATEEEIARGQRAVDYALSLTGLPYVWGGTDPRTGVDCSGLTQLAWRHAGVELPRLAADQARGRQVGFDQLIPGDLLVWSGHVAMYTGNGMLVEAGNPVQSSPVRTTNLGMEFLGCWRPAG
ncbi:C40 family peptidase [Corynebacterium mendelii]|uniref:C40 family peptidase n=1 Tax=Corynebacterium mendelii TaxID=2765362 RepID=UPI00366F7CEC